MLLRDGNMKRVLREAHKTSLFTFGHTLYQISVPYRTTMQVSVRPKHFALLHPMRKEKLKSSSIQLTHKKSIKCLALYSLLSLQEMNQRTTLLT
jgi:hypothetical protein